MEYVSGKVYVRGGFIDGYVGIEGGRVAEVAEGRCPDAPVASGTVVPGFVNGHTHAADGGLRIPEGISLEELVAPPDGLKHRYLRETPPDVLRGSMRAFSDASSSYGSSCFVDFREGGVEGCRLLREASPDAVVLGRPLSPEFDPCEVDMILDAADGIGLPSISDVPPEYCERIADAVRARGKLLGIHVSERVREDIDTVLSLDPSFVVHMTSASDDDILKCAEAEVPIVLCPRSNAFFGRVPPADRMAALGADLALGTDNAMLCEPDPRAEAKALRDILEARGCDPEAAASALLDGGRKILYRQNEIGIAVGRRADLAVLPSATGDPFRDVTGPGPGLLRIRRTVRCRAWGRTRRGDFRRGAPACLTEGNEMVFENILVPTDGSELTKAAVAQAVGLAKVTGSKVTALYVVDQAIFVNMPMDSAVMNVYNVLEEEGRNAVRFVEDLCGNEGVECELKVVEGTPVKAIIDLSSQYDLIVMGSLGRTGMSKLLMGSVAEKVVRGALCPVMVVKSPEAEEQ